MSVKVDKAQMASSNIYLQKLMKCYLKENRVVDTDEIISDIRFRKLSKADVELLLTDSRFNKAFQGKGFIKHPQEYLDNMQDDGIRGRRSRQRHCGDEWIPLPKSQWTKENFDNVWFDLSLSESESGISKEVLLYFSEMADFISPKEVDKESVFCEWSIWESMMALGITVLAIVVTTCIFFRLDFFISIWNIAAYIGMIGLLGYAIYRLVDATRRKKKCHYHS